MFLPRGRSQALSKGEKTIIERLLDGDTSFLGQLRRQMAPPFHLEVSRRHSKTRPAIYRPPANEYHLDLIYDDHLRREYSAGEEVSLKINDLVIRDQRIASEIAVEGHVNRGVLANIVFRTDPAPRWPKRLRVDEWWYVSTSGERTAARTDFGRYDLPVNPEKARNDLPTWIREYLDTAKELGCEIYPGLPASEAALAAMMTQLNIELPSDFLEFLRFSNGATIGSTTLFSCNEVYLLDDATVGRGKVAFAQLVDSSVCAFEMEGFEGRAEYPVLSFDHDSTDSTVVARSFREWLDWVIDGSISGRHDRQNR